MESVITRNMSLPVRLPEPYTAETVTTEIPSKAQYFDNNTMTSTFELIPDTITCSRPHTYLMYIMTAMDHFENRRLIRQTWANRSLLSEYPKHGFHIEHMFVIGGLKYVDARLAQRMRDESRRYGDILTVDALLDSYNNLTKKTIFTMYWIRAHCNLDNVAYMLKADDDVMLNMHHILARAWEAHINLEVTHFICHYLRRKFVDRTGKYAEPLWRYAGRKYPRYCSGPAYTLHPEAFMILFECIPSTPIMQSEDVMLTGNEIFIL